MKWKALSILHRVATKSELKMQQDGRLFEVFAVLPAILLEPPKREHFTCF
jgi:hypothetical protein